MPGSSKLLPPLRWITGILLVCVLVAVGLDLGGLRGHWREVALALAAVALTCYLIVLRLVRRQLNDVSTTVNTAVRAARAEAAHQVASTAGEHDAEFDALRNELEVHRKLQAELTEAKQAAEQATLAKSEFLATMSHEVRTPLNGIIPMLDLLQSSKLALDQREMLNTALQSARQLLRIVDDILDYSKLEANALQLENVSLNLRELLDSVIRLLERQAQAKGLRLSLHVDPDVRAGFRSDPLRLRQIISNLISNALKFTERGSITVNISRLSENRTHHQIRFEVRDTGVGISEEAAGKLFSAFSQADASTTRVYGGTGLGLAICKRIVDLMGGKIGVESELGRGSEFWFEIPMLKAASDIEGPRTGNNMQGARALALTSDPALHRRLSMSFAQIGLLPVFVETTQDALNQLRSAAAAPTRGFDMLVVDLASIKHTVVALHRNLMNMDGIERLRILFLEGSEAAPEDARLLPNAVVAPRTLAEIELRRKFTEMIAGEAISAASRDSTAEVSIAPAQERRATGDSPELASIPIKGRLLLVEDNPVNLLVAQRLITLTGMQCDTAENGEQAMEKLMRGHYDIVLMDCQMPVMDGYTATRNWRVHEADNHLQPMPIIAMTANAMAGDRQKCLDAGMDDYLSKPVAREHLENTLRRWLAAPSRLRRTADQAVAANTATPASAATQEAVPLAIPAQVPESSIRFAAAAVAAGLTAPQPAAAVASKPPSPFIPSRTAVAVTEPPPVVVAVSATAPAPAPVAKTAPALDSEIIEELWSAMGDQFTQLVTVFLDDAPGHLTKLEAAAMLGDVASMAGPAHALKSSSANLGAMEVSAAAKFIEHSARDRTLTDPVAAVAILGREFHRAEAELRTLLH